MSKIRVLRLLEYTYDTAENMDCDMQAWGMPATGVKKIGRGSDTIRSAILPPTILEDEAT